MGSKVSAIMANMKEITLPIVVVLGATGTGKSKLAIELAKKFNGEIISADSMQVYQGLDIITNKVTPEEQEEAVHHFISCVDPLSRYTVVDFRNRALPILNNLLQQNRLPIIVGGTNYYIESLLWDVLVKPEEILGSNRLLYDVEKSYERITLPDELITENHSYSDQNSADFGLSEKIRKKSKFAELKNILKHKITQDTALEIPSNVLHQLLSEVDPVSASTLHPNDKRKIIRSLQVYQKHQLPHSEILALQRSQNGGCSLGGPLRYKNSIMLWIQCDKPVLDKRLDERVDKMIENGLVKELLDFHHAYNQRRLPEKVDTKYTEGIFQSIGFKEYHEYLLLTEEEKMSEKGMKLYDKGVEDVKMITRKYAKKQLKWIKNRFLRQPDRDLPPVYGLNGTDLSRWNEDVFDVAYDIVNSTLQGKAAKISPLSVEKGEENVQETHYCEICDRIIIGRKTWEVHLSSRKHEKIKKGLVKKKHVATQNTTTPDTIAVQS